MVRAPVEAVAQAINQIWQIKYWEQDVYGRELILESKVFLSSSSVVIPGLAFVNTVGGMGFQRQNFKHSASCLIAALFIIGSVIPMD